MPFQFVCITQQCMDYKEFNVAAYDTIADLNINLSVPALKNIIYSSLMTKKSKPSIIPSTNFRN
eukprot:c18339_g1_i1 orf=420-611(+)